MDFALTLGGQAGLKIHQKLIQKSIQEAMNLVIDFGIHVSSIFDRNVVQQRPANTPKNCYFWKKFDFHVFLPCFRRGRMSELFKNKF